MKVFLTPEKIAANKKIFHTEFVKYFLKKLYTNKRIALKQQTPDKKSSPELELIEWVSLTGQIASISQPYIAPFIAISAKTLQTLIELKHQKEAKAAAKKIYSWIEKAIEMEVEITLEEVGSEAQRIFEFQLSVLANEESIVNVAQDAIERILDFGKAEGGKLAFERDVLLEGIIKGKTSSPKKLATIFDEPKPKKKLGNKKYDESKLWLTGEIFSEPEVVLVERGKAIYLNTKDGNYEKYGFRAEILKLSGDNYFTRHELDTVTSEKQFKLKGNPKIYKMTGPYLEYQPITHIATKEDLTEYANQLAFTKDKNDILEFNQFIAEKYYGDENREIIAVYRADGKDKTSLELKNGKFKNTDFIRADFHSTTLRNANFQNSLMLRVDLRGSKAQKLDLSHAKCIFCNISDKTILDEANLTQADMRFSIADETTQLSDIINTNLNAKGSTIYLAYGKSKFKKRVKELEVKVSGLEEENKIFKEGFKKYPFIFSILTKDNDDKTVEENKNTSKQEEDTQGTKRAHSEIIESTTPTDDTPTHVAKSSRTVGPQQ